MRTWIHALAVGAALVMAGPVVAQNPVVVGTAPTGVRTNNVVVGVDAWKALPLPALPPVLSGECRVLGARGGSIRHVSVTFPSMQDTQVSHTVMFGPQDVLVRYLRHHYPPGTRGMAAAAESTLQVDYQQGFALKMNMKDGRMTGAKVSLSEFERMEEFGLATRVMQAVLELCDP